MKNVITADLLFTEVEQNNFHIHAQNIFHNNHPKIVAYTVQGKPLTQEQYLQEINLAIRQVERKETINDEDLQKELETW